MAEASSLPEPVLEAGLRPATLGEGESGLTLLNLYRSPDGMRFWYHGHWQGFHDTIWRDLARERSIVFVSNNTIGSLACSRSWPCWTVRSPRSRRPGPRSAMRTCRRAATVPGIGNVKSLSVKEPPAPHVTGVVYALFRVEPASRRGSRCGWASTAMRAAASPTLVWRLMGDVEGTRSAAPPPFRVPKT